MLRHGTPSLNSNRFLRDDSWLALPKVAFWPLSDAGPAAEGRAGEQLMTSERSAVMRVQLEGSWLGRTTPAGPSERANPPEELRSGVSAGVSVAMPAQPSAEASRCTSQADVLDRGVESVIARQRGRVKGVGAAAAHDNVRQVGLYLRPAGSQQRGGLGTILHIDCRAYHTQGGTRKGRMWAEKGCGSK
jgi:hypothetical protein